MATALPTDLDALARSLGGIAPSWRGRAASQLPVQATGFPGLDELLPGGGWPLGALTELLPAMDGIGELSLTLPALKQLCRVQRRVALVDPPFLPHPPALQAQGLLAHTLWITTRGGEEGAWAAAQLLREPATGAVLLWNAQRGDRGLRRLQLAAESGGGLAFLFRDPAVADEPSPAALRLELHPAPGTAALDTPAADTRAPDVMEARLRKARGGRPGAARITLPRIPVWS